MSIFFMFDKVKNTIEHKELLFYKQLFMVIMQIMLLCYDPKQEGCFPTCLEDFRPAKTCSKNCNWLANQNNTRKMSNQGEGKHFKM